MIIMRSRVLLRPCYQQRSSMFTHGVSLQLHTKSIMRAPETMWNVLTFSEPICRHTKRTNVWVVITGKMFVKYNQIGDSVCMTQSQYNNKRVWRYLLCAIHKLKQRRGGLDGEIKRQKRQKCKQRPLGALETLQMKFITTPSWLIKSEIACDDGQMLSMQEVNVRLALVFSRLRKLGCACSFGAFYYIVSHLRTATALSKAYRTIMLPDGVPLGNSGISELSRICPPASCEPPEHLAHYLPVSGSSCLSPAVNYATVAFKMKADCL